MRDRLMRGGRHDPCTGFRQKPKRRCKELDLTAVMRWREGAWPAINKGRKKSS